MTRPDTTRPPVTGAPAPRPHPSPYPVADLGPRPVADPEPLAGPRPAPRRPRPRPRSAELPELDDEGGPRVAPPPRVLYAAPAGRDDGRDPREEVDGERGPGELVEVPVPDLTGGEPGVPGRIRDRVLATLGELRFVRERPSSLVDHLAYARVGQWTTQNEGQRRTAALVWAYTVAIPVTALAHFTVWAVARPTRAGVVAAVAAVLATALNQIPVVELLIPDWASLTAWPPLSWL